MEFELEGLWAHIHNKAPNIEVPELANLIGIDLIKTNSELWRELKAFSSILTEIHTLEFDKPLTTADDGGGTGKVLSLTQDNLDSANGKDIGILTDMPKLDISGSRKASLTAGNNDEQHSEQQLTRRSRTSIDSFDIVTSMEECINVSRIDEVVEKLRESFQEEKEELESEIAILYAALDHESDTIAAEVAKNITTHKKESNKRSLKIERFSPQGKRGTVHTFESKDSDGEEYSIMSQEPGRIRPRKSHSIAEEEKASRERTSRAEGTGVWREKSKVRNKLQAARDEKHFLDDDLF